MPHSLLASSKARSTHLHPGQRRQTGRLVRIAQRYHYLRVFSKRLRGDHRPLYDLGRLAVPHIDGRSQRSDSKRAPSGLADLQHRLITNGETLDDRLDLDGLGITSVPGVFSPSLAGAIRYIRLRILKIDTKIRVDVHNESPAHPIRDQAKSGTFPITGANPTEAKSLGYSVLNNLKGRLIFGAKNTLGLRKVTRLAPRNHFFHTAHVLAGTCLHQTAGVPASFFAHIVTAGTKMIAKSLPKAHKALTDTGQRPCLAACIRIPP